MSDKFEPIPSLNNLYEINLKGIVRNAKTKDILQYLVSFNAKGIRCNRSIESLLWEVFGQKSKKKYARHMPISAEKDGEKFYFNKQKDCAEFLAKKTHYTFKYMQMFLADRKKNIFGWKIKYWDEPNMIEIHH